MNPDERGKNSQSSVANDPQPATNMF